MADQLEKELKENVNDEDDDDCVLDDLDSCKEHHSAMLIYYPLQNICTEDEWAKVLASLEMPWQVTGRMPATLGWQKHTLVSLPSAVQLVGFPKAGSLLLGNASEMQPDVNKALHAKVIQLQKSGELFTQELASMLPPLLLNVSPHHRILDMCAAPGSKTLQILDEMQAGLPFGEPPKGLLVANDVDAKRLQKIVERAQVMSRSALVCSNVAAQKFPALLTGSRGQHRFTTWSKPSQREPEGQFKVKFDRVLCDVPCSSDGGIRKGVRRPWSASDALALHVKQLGILQRGLELLVSDGLLVYSTCSLNPIEDEAVVAAMLRAVGQSSGIEIVDARHVLGDIPFCSGVKTWQVPHPEFGCASESFLLDAGAPGGLYASFRDVPPLLRGGKIRDTMFPPASNGADAEWIKSQLERCMRILPSGSTGGFFLALFKKCASPGKQPRSQREGESVAACENQDVAQGEDEDSISLPASEPVFSAGCHVTVCSSGAPAVILGPGSGKYRGLIKIRYPDKATYHVSAADIRIADPPAAKSNQRPDKKNASGCDEEVDNTKQEQDKSARRPGARLFRTLGEKSANVAAVESFFGLHRDEDSARAAGVDVFPSAQLAFRTKDPMNLYLVSAGLMDLRVPRGYWPVSSGMPFFRRVDGEQDLLRWGKLCPLRPCREAAPLLARCASRRRLSLSAVHFAQLMRTKCLTEDELRHFSKDGRLGGFESCLTPEGCVGLGAVVVLLSNIEAVSNTLDAEKCKKQAHVAVIGSLTAEGLEVFLDRDVGLRLAEIAESTLTNSA